jgi:hypothetical protein
MARKRSRSPAMSRRVASRTDARHDRSMLKLLVTAIKTPIFIKTPRIYIKFLYRVSPFVSLPPSSHNPISLESKVNSILPHPTNRKAILLYPFQALSNPRPCSSETSTADHTVSTNFPGLGPTMVSVSRHTRARSMLSLIDHVYSWKT